ncbi:MAG: CBS domain-containing protein [Verrucomicrobiaceae bacterium]|nr:MAG: CBS domain-containing protein [Verrucomicrobiaceae bacterium]
MEITTPVGSILDRKGHQLWSINAGATVYDAIALMAEKNVGALPVMEGSKLLGMISERDYTRKVILHGRVSRETRVVDIMTSDVFTVAPGDSVEDCLEIMTKNHIRHLPVIESGDLAGIVSIGDLVNWIILAQAGRIDDLQRYVTGAYPA